MIQKRFPEEISSQEIESDINQKPPFETKLHEPNKNTKKRNGQWRTWEEIENEIGAKGNRKKGISTKTEEAKPVNYIPIKDPRLQKITYESSDGTRYENIVDITEGPQITFRKKVSTPQSEDKTSYKLNLWSFFALIILTLPTTITFFVGGGLDSGTVYDGLAFAFKFLPWDPLISIFVVASVGAFASMYLGYRSVSMVTPEVVEDNPAPRALLSSEVPPLGELTVNKLVINPSPLYKQGPNHTGSDQNNQSVQQGASVASNPSEVTLNQ